MPLSGKRKQAQQKQISNNQKAKANQDSSVSSSKQSRGDNRGFNSSNNGTTGFVPHTMSPVEQSAGGRKISVSLFESLGITDQAKVSVHRSVNLNEQLAIATAITRSKRNSRAQANQQKQKAQTQVNRASARVQGNINKQREKVAKLQAQVDYNNSPQGKAEIRKRQNRLSRGQKRRGVVIQGINATANELRSAKGTLKSLEKSHGQLKSNQSKINKSQSSSFGRDGNSDELNALQKGTNTTVQKSQLKVHKISFYQDDTRSLQEQMDNPAQGGNPIFGPYIQTKSDAEIINKNRQQMRDDADRGNLFTTKKLVKGLGLGGFDIVTNTAGKFDNEFELNKLVKERSTKVRPYDLPSNQILGDFVAPASNFGSMIGDFANASIKHAQGKKGFKKNDQGLPVPISNSPMVDTAFSKVLSGRPVDVLGNKRDKATALGEAGFLGAQFLIPGGQIISGIKYGAKLSGLGNRIQTPKVKPTGLVNLRPGPGKNIFAQDTAMPSMSGTLIHLGRGIGKGPGTPSASGNVNKIFKTKGGGSFVQKSFQEPKGNPGKSGLIQKQKLKGPQTLNSLGIKLQTKNKSQQVRLKTSQSMVNDILHKKKTKTKQNQQSYITYETIFKPQTKSALDFAVVTKQKTSTKQKFKQAQKQGFKQSPKLVTAQMFKQVPKQKQEQAFAFVPFTQGTTGPVPFRPVTPRTPPRTILFPPGLFPAGRGGSWMGQRKKSAFRKYTTTAISSDISQKILPGKFLRTSKSRKVFTQLDKLQKKQDKKTRPTFLFGGQVETTNKGKIKKKSGKGLPIVSGNTARALGL